MGERQIGRWITVGGIVLTCGGIARGAVLTDFEAGANGATNYLFRTPNVSATTSANIKTAPSPVIQRVTTSFTAAPGGFNLGTKVGELQFEFTDTAATRWIRHTTSSSTTLPNPYIDISQTFSFDVFATEALSVSLIVREVAGTGAIGANGGATGTLEYVGATAPTSPGLSSTSAPIGKSVPADTWTHLTFNFQTDTIKAATGGGTLNSAGGYVLEALAITTTGNAGPITMYYDNFEQNPVPEPGALAWVGLLGMSLLRRRH